MYIDTNIHLHANDEPTFRVELSGIGSGTIVLGVMDREGNAVATLFLHNSEDKGALGVLQQLRSAIDQYLRIAQ